MVTAASVRPSGLNASALTSPPVSQQGRAGRLELARIPEPDPSVLEADGDQPAVRAEPPRVPVRPFVVERSVVRERERPPEPRGRPSMSQAIAVPSELTV